ncbi:MAG TPA: hypothetical protein VHD81_06740 [Mycobacteriales bacterium]|nr:hypothetical protein [Mycobacteriales bacterium]
MGGVAKGIAIGMVVVAAGACSGSSSRGLPQEPEPPSKVSATLILSSTSVQTGKRISGRIEIVNDTGKAIHIAGCGGLFQVLLTSPSYHPQPAWTDCLQLFTIPTGHYSERVTVQATYNSCGHERPTASVPRCTTDGIPALPPGEYAATVFERTNVIPRAAAIPVLVTR